MGLGNGNGKQGNKGSNFNYELRHLQLLGQLAAAAPLPPGSLATEATLLSVLNAIIASDQDIEILLVRDTGNADQVVQQITNYETGTPVVTYKDVNGAAYVPVGPLEYLDPSAVLNLILTELQSSTLTPSYDIVNVVGAGSIAAGAREVSIKNNGAVAVTIDGSLLPVGESIGWNAGGQSDRLDAISYDIPATGSIQILKVV